MRNGDVVTAEAILNRFINKLEIRGAVYRPGIYQLNGKLNTVRELVNEAQGLTGDAFLNRAVLYRQREDLTTEVAGFLKEQGFDTFTLSTESCDICETCAYTQGEPCRFPERMHPCLESHGVVVSEIVEKEHMEYSLGGNTILWFSMVLYRAA